MKLSAGVFSLLKLLYTQPAGLAVTSPTANEVVLLGTATFKLCE